MSLRSTGNDWTGVWCTAPMRDPDVAFDASEAIRQSERDYEEACAAFAILPSPAVMDQLSRSRFELARYGLGPLGGRALGAALANNLAVKVLDLAENSLGPQGIEAVATALFKNKTVTRLNLSRNSATNDPGMIAALVGLFEMNRTLTAVCISGNAVGDRGMRQILDVAVEAARVSLSELDIGDTGAGVASAPAVAALLREGRALARVGLARLQLPAASWADTVLPALSASTSITALDLSNNNMGHAAIAPLSKCLTTLSLQMVDLSNLGWTQDSTLSAFSEALETANESIEMLLLDVGTGARLRKEQRRRRKAAKAANIPADSVCKSPRIVLRPCASSEAGTSRLDIQLLSARDMMRPAERLLSGPDSVRVRRQRTGANGGASLLQTLAAKRTTPVPPPAAAAGAGVKTWGKGNMAGSLAAARTAGPPKRSSLLAAASKAAVAVVQPPLPWEGNQLERAVAREMQDLAEVLADSRPATATSLWMVDEWEGSFGDALETALKEARDEVRTAPLAVDGLRRLALAKQALSDYHAAAIAFLESMASTQEDPAMVSGFRQALAAMRIRRERIAPEPVRHPAKRSGWGKYGLSDTDDSGDDGPPKRTRRRHQKYLPPSRGAPPPPSALLCRGYEDVLMRLWDFFEQGPDSPEWERYRLRNYFMDAQADLRVIYDWYRSLPFPGDPPLATTDPLGLCTEDFHCCAPATDDEGVRGARDGTEYSVCDVCAKYGKLSYFAIGRHVMDAGLIKFALQPSQVNRQLAPVWRTDAELGPAPEGETPEDDNTLAVRPRGAEAAAAAAEAAAERAVRGMHVGRMRVGFYEWVEFMARMAFIVNNGKKEGIAWAMDRFMLHTVPDDVSLSILPVEVYGENGPDWTPEEIASMGGGLPTKQPLTWDLALPRGTLAQPLPEGRDAFRKRFQGPGRNQFMALHRVRLQRVFLFFGDTERYNGSNRVFDLSQEEMPGDVTINFNEILRMYEKLDLFNADLTPVRLQAVAVKMTGYKEIMGQEHPNNQRIEFGFEEWLELVARCAPNAKTPPPQVAGVTGEASKMWHSLSTYLLDWYYPAVYRVWPGKWRE